MRLLSEARFVIFLLFALTVTAVPSFGQSGLRIDCGGGGRAGLVFDESLGTIKITHDGVERSFSGAKLGFDEGGRSYFVFDEKKVQLAVFDLPSSRVEGLKFRSPFGFLSCNINMPIQNLHERFISNSSSQKAMQMWKDWVRSQDLGSGQVCDPVFDSFGYFQPGRNNKIAVVFHGVGSNPAAMGPVFDLMIKNGYSVLAPRLSKHFDVDVYDLRESSFRNWITESENVFQIAKQLGSQVTLLGYSLGGLLAGRLTIYHNDDVDKLVGIAPAWRIFSTASLLAGIGDLTSLSYNLLIRKPALCDLKNEYLPAEAGEQVQLLGFDLERKFDGNFNLPAPTAFAKIVVPYLLFTSTDDMAIDVGQITEICQDHHLICRQVMVKGINHTHMIQSLNESTPGLKAGDTMAKEITQFLKSSTGSN